MSSFRLTVSSPDGDVFSGEVQRLVLRGAEGDLAILAGHTPFITSIKSGNLKIEIDDNTIKSGNIDGGMLAVSENDVTLLSSSVTFE